MPGETTYTIPDEVLTAQLEGEAVLLDLQTKRYYRLNATAARIWKGVEDRLEPNQIVSALMEEFTVAISMPSVVLDSAIHLYRDPAPAAGSAVRGCDDTDGTGAPPAE